VAEAEINWTKKIIRAQGCGVPNRKYPRNVQLRSAIKAAKIDALRNLIEFTNGLKIESKTFSTVHQIDSDIIVSKVKGLIKEAYQVGETAILDDGSVEVTMEVDVRNIFPE
jgi:hypothetical protein